MQRSCPSCGAETLPGMRFCRRCGAPLHAAGGDGTGQVSPQAATVPLAGEGRATDDLADSDRPSSADTTRVTRAEVEHLLRQAQPRGRSEGQEATLVDAEGGAPAEQTPRRATRHNTSSMEEGAVARAKDSRSWSQPSGGDQGEDLTITVPRQVQPLDAEAGTGFARPRSAGSMPPMTSEAAVAPAPAEGTPRPAAPRRKWPVVAVCASVLLFTVAAWLVSRYWRRPAPTEVATQAPVAPPAPDPKQVFEEKLTEAESLLAQGNMDGAVARLREANTIDPANTRAHRRLGELLLAGGARREAIEEFRAVTNNDPNDFTAWRQLATAQFAGGLYRDAAESYRRLAALVGESSADPHDLLSYADSLRLSGRAAEARSLYQRLTNAAASDVAGAARRQLEGLAQPTPAPTPSPRHEEAAGAQPPRQGETVTPPASGTAPAPAPTAPTVAAQPTPAPTPVRAAELSPADRYRRGTELWASNRAAAFNEFQAAAGGGSVDANYYLGLYYVEGKDLRAVDRAALVAALRHFQIAQRGQYAAQSRRYAQQLESEFDRRRRQ